MNYSLYQYELTKIIFSLLYGQFYMGRSAPPSTEKKINFLNSDPKHINCIWINFPNDKTQKHIAFMLYQCVLTKLIFGVFGMEHFLHSRILYGPIHIKLVP